MPISALPSNAPAEVDNIIEAFKTWDETGSGMISREDLSTIIRALSPGIGAEDLDRLFSAAASEGMMGNQLRYEDFVAWLWRPMQAPAAAAAKCQVPAAPAFDPAEEERRRRGLWQGALQDAVSKGVQKYPKEKVQQYFDEVQKRLAGEEYAKHVQGVVFHQVDTDKDGKISFGEVTSIIGKSLQCASDMVAGDKVTMEEIRAAFDAHDTLVNGRGFMGEDEFLNLMRYLQVRVAEAAMPMSKVIRGA